MLVDEQRAIQELAILVSSLHRFDYGVRAMLFLVGFSQTAIVELRSWKFTDVYDAVVRLCLSLSINLSIH